MLYNSALKEFFINNLFAPPPPSKKKKNSLQSNIYSIQFATITKKNCRIAVLSQIIGIIISNG